MADAFYTNGLKHFARGNILWLNSGGSNIKLVGMTSAYTFSAAHEFHSSLTNIEETSGNFTLVDAADDGILDASDVVLLATAGSPIAKLAIYRDSGVSGTSQLIAYIDAAAGLPVTLGGDVTVQWDNGANKIMKI